MSESVEWHHLDGTACAAGWDVETGMCVEGHGPVLSSLVLDEVERLRLALGWYADPDVVINPGPRVAREALGRGRPDQ